jgi:spore germination cell wall hydrolase CwlJ-like protein
MTRSILYLFLFLIGISLVFVPTGYDQTNITLVPMAFVKQADLNQITCMAKNIYYEAAGESILGQAAVARVVINRVNHGFAKTPCGVIYQSFEAAGIRMCQFSWVCADVPVIDSTHPSYIRAVLLAKEILINNAYRDVIPESVLFFHNVLIKPNWSYQQIKIIGNHLFYSRTKSSKPVVESFEE